MEISQAAREAVQALRAAGLCGWSDSARRRALEIIQLAIEHETRELRDNVWKYEMLSR